MMEYVGARWLKCDFHLHTPASQCFKDKNVTPEMWVQACLDQKLDCVAVTDHNTNAWVDAVKTAAEKCAKPAWAETEDFPYLTNSYGISGIFLSDYARSDNLTQYRGYITMR